MASNGKLPKGWKQTTLGEISEVRRGASPRPIANPKWFSETGPGWVRIVDVTRSTKYLRKTEQQLSEAGARKSIRVAHGDVIMSICATIGCPVIVDMHACIHDGFVLFDKLSKSVDPEYLCTFLAEESQGFARQGQKGTQGNLNTTIVKSTRFPLPPRTVQSRIVGILNAVDEAIEATREVIDQTRRLKAALLQDLLTKGLGHKTFKKTKQGKIPSTWTLKTVGELCEFSSGHGFSHGDWSTKGLPIIRIQNLNGSSDFNYYAGEPDPRWIVEPGELLFAWAGVKGVSFGPCLWSGPTGLLNQHIYRIRPNSGIDQGWLYAILGEVTHRIEAKAHGFKTSLVHVHKSDITDQVIATPPPEEQVLIAKRASDLDNVDRSQDEYLAQLSRMKSALSQGLLTGRIPVKGVG